MKFTIAAIFCAGLVHGHSHTRVDPCNRIRPTLNGATAPFPLNFQVDVDRELEVNSKNQTFITVELSQNFRASGALECPGFPNDVAVQTLASIDSRGNGCGDVDKLCTEKMIRRSLHCDPATGTASLATHLYDQVQFAEPQPGLCAAGLDWKALRRATTNLYIFEIQCSQCDDDIPPVAVPDDSNYGPIDATPQKTSIPTASPIASPTKSPAILDSGRINRFGSFGTSDGSPTASPTATPTKDPPPDSDDGPIDMPQFFDFEDGFDGFGADPGIFGNSTDPSLVSVERLFGADLGFLSDGALSVIFDFSGGGNENLFGAFSRDVNLTGNVTIDFAYQVIIEGIDGAPADDVEVDVLIQFGDEEPQVIDTFRGAGRRLQQGSWNSDSRDISFVSGGTVIAGGGNAKNFLNFALVSVNFDRINIRR